MERIGTGNSQLDCVLDGGFPANSIHVVMGAPGQRQDDPRRAARVHERHERAPSRCTHHGLPEPLQKVLSFLQEYSFADASRVGYGRPLHELG